VETLSRNYNLSIDDARTEIEDHVGPNASVNNAQRILLIAENFDPARSLQLNGCTRITA
jgi:hypothetical protein